MADKKDSFIVQVTIDFDGQTDPEHVMNRVWEQLEKMNSEGFHFPGISAWRIFDHGDRSSNPANHAMPSHQKYESCVLQSDGKCHRSSHDHSNDF